MGTSSNHKSGTKHHSSAFTHVHSDRLFEEANQVFPGGVNSPVRAFRSVGGKPVFFQRAQGQYLWDVDDQRYIDYVGSWGPAIVGHTHPEVLKAVVDAASKGFTFGAPTEGETVLARKIIAALPAVEKLRLVSSGTEACMSALRLARAFTKRDKFIKFSGCYHGHADFFLVKAGSGVATFSLPDSPGVPKESTQHTLIAPYNDIEAVKKLFQENRGEIAAIILEPIVGNSGFIRGSETFLKELREITKVEGSLLIFDEVMTGFRVAYGGVQTLTGIRPDLTTLGKVVGGGMPLAAYGGRADIMDWLAPKGPVYQAGTLSGNPVAVACGLKTLELLETQGTYRRLHSYAERFMKGLKERAQDRKIPLQVDWQGGMFGYFFSTQMIHNYEQAQQADMKKYSQFFQGMLAKGVYLAPSGYEAAFVSAAHEDKDLDQTLSVAEEVLAKI